MPSTSDPHQALDTEGLIDFTRRLVRVKSVNRPEEGLGEAEAAELVRAQAEAFGWNPVVEEVAAGRPNVIVEIDGGSPGKTLLFEGHTDVVTEGDPADWSVDPFGGDLIDGRIYGRGAADMKGGVAAMMFAAKAFTEAGPFAGKIKLAIVCDEEEMMIGIKDFLDRGHAKDVAGAIICEPEAGEVCTVQKGAMRLRVDLFGVMAHGAMPHQGKNPLVGAGALITELRLLEARLQDAYGEHEHLGLPYVTPTHFDAGSLPQLNVIPSQGLLTLDIRTIPGIGHEELLAEIRSIADGISEVTGVEFEFTVLVDRPPTETSHDDPVVRAVVEAHKAVLDETPAYGGVPGTTDGTILWRDAAIPVVVYGPGGKWIAHQHDEYVEVDDLIRHAQVYVEAARRFLAG